MQGSRRAILDYLRHAGAAPVDRLAQAVDLAPVTVRHHLKLLRERGLVDVVSEPAGRGRPRHVYRLSPEGAGALCEGRYASLASQLLDLVKQLDQGGAERFFSAMAAGVVADRRAAIDAAEGLEARLDLLVEILDDQGFPARWEPSGGDFLLHELGCPYAELGERHDEVCSLDLALIRATVGGEVTRERWRLDGDAACVFRIRPAGAC
ncbi:MAG: helix-turn-helix domain-containing protein [Caldilineae bacterium]|nr:helix-turn-helix domain-containing protein [Chloroflexota bacterium]MCB9177385.1 helix-turn-helix domain-containing protein [Caldilineae bacterium]